MNNDSIGNLQEETKAPLQKETEAHEKSQKEIGEQLAGLANLFLKGKHPEELALRERYLGTGSSLFATRKERAEIVFAYYQIYGPLNRWDAFLKAAKLARSTSYTLIKLAGGTAEQPEEAKEPPKLEDMLTSKLVSLVGEFSKLPDATDESIAFYLEKLSEVITNAVDNPDKLKALRASLEVVKRDKPKDIAKKLLEMPKSDQEEHKHKQTGRVEIGSSVAQTAQGKKLPKTA
jgi:hypothetical protein